MKRVSINSTSYKGSDQEFTRNERKAAQKFPLIPLPIKEAIIWVIYEGLGLGGLFPLIPLPIKEAISKFSLQGYSVIPFPLIPLPIKEAMASTEQVPSTRRRRAFPLIPLPIKEAM